MCLSIPVMASILFFNRTRLTSFSAVEFATLTLDANKKPKAKIYKPSEIDALLQKHGLGKKDEDAEMAAA